MDELFRHFEIAANKARESLEATASTDQMKIILRNYCRYVSEIVITDLGDKFHAAVKEETRRVVIKVFDEFIEKQRP